MDTKNGRKNQPEQSSIYRELAPYLSLGYQLVAPAGLLGGIGWWIDRENATQPLWFVAGLSVGCVVGLVTLIRAVLKSGGK
jgi:F0F1-type ATP synthase assembly protein I